LSRAAYADTITARPAAPLVVTLLDTLGRPAPGQDIQFVASWVSGATDGDARPAALVGSQPDAFLFSDVLTVRTDAEGSARVWLMLGTRAGSGVVRVTAPAPLEATDSVSITVREGAPHSIRSTGPRDTALYVGASIPLGGTVEDRGANPLAIRPVWASRRPQIADVEVDASGSRFRTVATGRAWAVATAGGMRDSVALSVVPRGELAAHAHFRSSGTPVGIYIFQLDGSGYRLLNYNTGSNPRWAPDGERLVVHNGGPGDGRGRFPLQIVVLDPTTGVRRVLVAGPAGGMFEAMQPQPSADGQWVYFVAVFEAFQTAEVWRVAWDGAGLGRVGPAANPYERDLQPSPSPPDGSRIVFLSTRDLSQGLRMRRYDTGNSSLVNLGVAEWARRPRWSPNGAEIAYYGGGHVNVVRPDGAGALALGPKLSIGSLSGYDEEEGQIDWSPDGQWLVACVLGQYSGERSLTLINRQSGELLPLAFTARDNLCDAAWRPR
jgi:Tol biopolymer transport system component